MRHKTPSEFCLRFPKIRQHIKLSGVMLIWLSAILLSTAGIVVRVVRTTDGSTSSAGTTMTHHQPWPVEKIHHARSYGSDATVLDDYALTTTTTTNAPKLQQTTRIDATCYTHLNSAIPLCNYFQNTVCYKFWWYMCCRTEPGCAVRKVVSLSCWTCRVNDVSGVGCRLRVYTEREIIEKAKDELNEDPKNRLGAVQKFRELVLQQPHIRCPTGWPPKFSHLYST